MATVSTMGVGFRSDGTVERYVPPRVVEESGGGGPPFVSDALSSTPYSGPLAAGPAAVLTSLALPAGQWLVWLTFTIDNIATAGIVMIISGVSTSIQHGGGGSASNGATEPTVETGPTTIEAGGSGLIMPNVPVTTFTTQIFARKIGD